MSSAAVSQSKALGRTALKALNLTAQIPSPLHVQSSRLVAEVSCTPELQ